jgi:hypothetical protein
MANVRLRPPARDATGKTRPLPPCEPIQHEGFTWWSRGDLMAWNPNQERVERYRSHPDGFKQVESWELPG